jgi:hypothetical protein
MRGLDKKSFAPTCYREVVLTETNVNPTHGSEWMVPVLQPIGPRGLHAREIDVEFYLSTSFASA